MHLAVIFFTVNRRRVPLVLIAWFGLLNSYFSFRRLFAVGLSRDNGNISDLFQKIAEYHLCRYSDVFGRIREVFSGRRVSQAAILA